jgi:hypothetical protein
MRLKLLVRALAARAPQVLLWVLRRRQARPQPRRLAVGGEVICALRAPVYFRSRFPKGTRTGGVCMPSPPCGSRRLRGVHALVRAHGAAPARGAAEGLELALEVRGGRRHRVAPRAARHAARAQGLQRAGPRLRRLRSDLTVSQGGAGGRWLSRGPTQMQRVGIRWNREAKGARLGGPFGPSELAAPPAAVPPKAASIEGTRRSIPAARGSATPPRCAIPGQDALLHVTSAPRGGRDRRRR